MADLPPGDWLHGAIGVKIVNVVAGVCGGLVSGLVVKGFTWPERISSAVVGGMTAGYGTPAAMPVVRKWLDLWSSPNGDVEGVVGFVLGLIGMTVCDATINWVKSWWKKNPPTKR